MTAGIDIVAAFAIGAFLLFGFALMLFMMVAQPIWCVVDCAVDTRRSAFAKGLWIVVLIVLYGVSNWFYGALAAQGAWLRRLTRLAWLFAIALVIGFIVLYNTSEGFRRGIDERWQHKRGLTVMLTPASVR